MKKPNTHESLPKSALATAKTTPATPKPAPVIFRHHDTPSSPTPELPPLYLRRKSSTPVLLPLYPSEDESELELLPPPTPLHEGYSPPDTAEIKQLEWEARHDRPDRKKLSEMMGLDHNDKSEKIRLRAIVRSYIHRYCDLSKAFDEYPYYHFVLPLVVKTTLYLNKKYLADNPWTKSVTQHVIKAIFTDDRRNAKTKATKAVKRELEFQQIFLTPVDSETPPSKKPKVPDEMGETSEGAAASAASAHPEFETSDKHSSPGPRALDETVENSLGAADSAPPGPLATGEFSTIGSLAAEPLKEIDSRKRTDTPKADIGVPKVSNLSATAGSVKAKRPGKVRRMKYIFKHNGSSRMFTLLPDATWDILADVIMDLIEDIDLYELGVFLQYLPVVVFDEYGGIEWKDLNGEDDLRMAVRSHRSGLYVRLDPTAYGNALQEQRDEVAH